MTPDCSPTASSTTSAIRPGGVLLRAATPADLVRTLPYLFGFVLRESVVVLAFHGRRVESAARIDVSAVLEANQLGEEAVLKDRLAVVGRASRQLMVVVLDDDLDRAEQAVDITVRALGSVRQTIIVRRGRCRSGDGDWVDCEEGIPQADEAGLTVLPGRDDLVTQVAGPGRDASAMARWASARQAVSGLTESGMAERAAALLKQGLGDPGGLTDDELMEVAALVREGSVRDHLWPLLTSINAAQHVALWRAVVKLVPDAGAPAVLGLMGMAAWVNGEGALQVCCVERGLGIDAEHSLLRLVETINLMGVHPREWAKMRRSLMAESAG